MLYRTRFTMLCASVCIIILAMEAGVLRAENPTNSSQIDTTTTTELNTKKSSIEKGMDVLYDMTNTFLSIIQPERLYDQKWLNLTAVVRGNSGAIDYSNWQEITKYGLGFSLCLAAGILFALFMPLVGCCFCCCRLAGKCGGKKKIKDPKHAKCKRNSYCTILLVINTVSLAGVVCAFVTNDIFHRKLENEDNKGPIGNINTALTNVQMFVNKTTVFLEENALNKFDEANREITTAINKTADNAVDKVLELVDASSYLDQAKRLSEKTNIVLTDLNNISYVLANLKSNGLNLSTELTNLKTEIEVVCAAGTLTCDSLNLNQYKTEADFSGLSELSSEINKVSDSLNISKYVKQAEANIDEVKKNATDIIQSSIIEASKTMSSIRTDVKKGFDDYKDQIISGTKPLTDAKNTVNSNTKEIEKYGNYIWYAGIGISCVFLLIILFYYMGVLFGACGERPGHEAACCNTSVGGNFLKAGVAFSFVFSWILVIICFLMFIPGGLLYTEICRYFQDHDPSLLKPFDEQLIQSLDLTKKLFSNSTGNISLVRILQDCEQNRAIYSALQLDNVADLNKLLDVSLIDTEIDNIIKSTINFDNITILSSSLEAQINKFGESGIESIDYAAYETEMKKNLTAVDLKELSKKLKSHGSTQIPALKAQYDEFAATLLDLDTRLVQPMNNDVTKLKVTLQKLKDNSNVKNETDALILGLREAEIRFNTNGTTLVNEMIKTVAESVKKTVKDKILEVQNLVRNDAGKCRPIFDALYTLTDSVCVIILNPLNGFWFSMGWCLFFFIPSIIFAVKLSTLYQREEEYVHEKEFDDASGQHDRGGYGAHNTGYHDDGGKSSNNGYTDGPPAYGDYNRGERNGNRYGRPPRY